MSKYAAYDQKLLALIDEGSNTTNKLILGLLHDSQGLSDCAPATLTERRIQELRRTGKIVFNRSKRIWLRAQVSEVPQ